MGTENVQTAETRGRLQGDARRLRLAIHKMEESPIRYRQTMPRDPVIHRPSIRNSTARAGTRCPRTVADRPALCARMQS
jgi:hypothetical protein